MSLDQLQGQNKNIFQQVYFIVNKSESILAILVLLQQMYIQRFPTQSIHIPHSLTCLNQGSSKSQVTYWFRKNFLLYSRVKQFRRAPEQFGFEKLFQGLPLAPTLWSSSSQSYYVLFTYKDFSLIESQFGYATTEAARIFVSGETSCKTCRK